MRLQLSNFEGKPDLKPWVLTLGSFYAGTPCLCPSPCLYACDLLLTPLLKNFILTITERLYNDVIALLLAGREVFIYISNVLP